MSKTEKVNKSEMIRQQLKSMKPSERSPKAVSEALKAKGVDVTPGLVGIVKMKMGPKKRKAKIKTKTKVKTRKSRTAVAWKAWNTRRSSDKDFGNLVLAKNFLNSAGGIEKAKKTLDLVSKLMS